MSDDRVVEAIQNAANESVIYQAEMHVEAINKARKRRRIDQEQEVNEHKKVDDSDMIQVIGFRKSLMHSVRALGLSYSLKNLKNINITDKYYAKLALNSIVDIYDKHYMGLLNFDDSAVEDLKKRYSNTGLTIPRPNDMLIQAYGKADDMRCKQAYIYFTTNQFKYNNDDQVKMSIMALIYKVLSNQNSILSKWKTASEWTIIIKVWANIFETLFENTDIDLIWGDTKNELLKVDLRFCLNYAGKLYDISNIEFKKNGNDANSVKSDGAKVLIEAKTILNKLSEVYNMDFNEAKNLKTIVGQACGLKIVFSELRITAPGCYMASKFGKTIKHPFNKQSAKKFGETNLEQLFCFSRLILNEAYSLKNTLQKDSSSFGSQSTIQDQSFTKRPYVLSDKAVKWPTLHDDFFKS